MYGSEIDKQLNKKLQKLFKDIDFHINGLKNYSTFTENGVFVPNSRIAVKTAADLLKVSKILSVYEDTEMVENGGNEHE